MQTVTWQEGKPAPYLLIARAFAAMEGTTKRLKKDEIMVDAYRAILQRCPGVLIFCPPLQLPMCLLTCVCRLRHTDSCVVESYPDSEQPASAAHAMLSLIANSLLGGSWSTPLLC